MQVMHFIFVITAIILCACSTDGKKVPAGSGILDLTNDQLTQRLSQEQVHKPEVFVRAVEILEAIESAPSCHRLATFDLIDSCQSLETSSTSETSLANVRERYATRLAMCELISAKVPAPPNCDSFVPSTAACHYETFSQKLRRTFRAQSDTASDTGVTCFPQANDQATKLCLHSLHSRPQWWTSYSNALQNVLIVCQAGRNAVEKDDILRAFRKSAQASSDMSSALAVSLKQAAEFNIAVERLKSRMLHDWHKQAEDTKGSFAVVIIDIQKAIHAALSSLTGGINTSVEKLADMHLDVVKSHAEVLKTNTAVEALHQNIMQQNAEIATQHHDHMLALSSRALTVEEQLQNIIKQDLAPIREAASNYLYQLRNFTDVVAASNLGLEQHLSISTEKLERQAEALSKIKAPSESLVTASVLMLLLGIALPTLAPAWIKFAVASVLTIALINLSGLWPVIWQGLVRCLLQLRNIH